MQESEYKKLLSTLIEPNIGKKTIDCIIKRLNDEDRTTGDTIYRQDAIDCVSEMLNGIFVENEDIAKKAIGKLPSAQSERTKAKWVKTEIGWKCSNCTLCTNIKGKTEFSFCPNCGCQMEGEDDGTD